MFPVKETIQSRKSVRTFDGRPLSATDREKLEQYLADVPNPFGTKVEFRLLNAKEHGVSSPVIVGSDLYIAAKATMSEGYEVGYGYSFELACLYAESIGVGTVMLAASLSRKAFEKAMELKEGEVMPVATPVGYAAEKLSLRDAAMRKALKADKRMAFDELFFDGSFDKGLEQKDADIFGEALEMARWAPSASNRQPWCAVVDGNTVHFFEKRTLPLTHFGDTQMIDTGIALAHFDLMMQEEG
ncbi:MAG: nitroreductase family protein, partial [Coriobacteriales bacterium]|nr:nitroreductase family protein [Coriobacteriales bacterium]